MPHTPEEKKKAITRLRRIRGQAEALERAVEAETDCRQLLQQLAALRGAANGLFAEILEGHMRETLGPRAGTVSGQTKKTNDDLDEILSLLRSYLK